MSKINYDKFLFFDLELECWNDISRIEQSNKTHIIEIGITEVSLSEQKIIKTKSYLINRKDLEISSYCTELTGITKEMILEFGKTLPSVSKQIRKDFGESACYFGAWGNDYDFLKKDCSLYQAVFPFNGCFINIQDFFSMRYHFSQRQKQNFAMEFLNIPNEGQIHRAGSDSLNGAKVVLKMFNK